MRLRLAPVLLLTLTAGRALAPYTPAPVPTPAPPTPTRAPPPPPPTAVPPTPTSPPAATTPTPAPVPPTPTVGPPTPAPAPTPRPTAPPAPTPPPGAAPPWVGLGNGFATTALTVKNAPAGAHVRLTYVRPDGIIQTADIPLAAGASTQRVVTDSPSGTTLLVELISNGAVIATYRGAPVP